MDAGEQEVFGRVIDVSSVDKVFFDDDGITKGELVGYYRRVAETMLPYLVGRPVAMKRFPDGLGGEGFFQKNAGSHFPDWLRREDIPKREGGVLDHVVVDEPATIVYLANQGTIELHGWLSTAADLEHPDQVVFDLDPANDDVAAVRRAARHVRALLDELGLASLLKTSGSAGYHVHVPLDGSADFTTAGRFAAAAADLLARRHSDELTDEARRDKRKGRVFVDHLRNAYGQTVVAPYGVRARSGAPVATPIDWDELGSAEPRSYTIRNLFRRLGQRDDPWAKALENTQRLDDAGQRLEAFLAEAS